MNSSGNLRIDSFIEKPLENWFPSKDFISIVSYLVDTAFNEPDTIGGCVITLSKRNSPSYGYYIASLEVSNLHRGRGYGKLLLTKAIHSAMVLAPLSDDNGFITLAVQRENIIAVNLYTLLGFRMSGKDFRRRKGFITMSILIKDWRTLHG